MISCVKSAIIGFKVPETGLYAIVDSVLTNGDAEEGDLGVSARVYTGDHLVLHRTLPAYVAAEGIAGDVAEEISLDATVGQLQAGDMIFIAVSAGSSGKPMHFRLDFRIMQGGCPGSSDVNPPNAARTASSVWGANVAENVQHNQGRLNSPQAWSAAMLDVNQWYQLDAGALVHITGVALQGRANAAQWVTSYVGATPLALRASSLTHRTPPLVTLLPGSLTNELVNAVLSARLLPSIP